METESNVVVKVVDGMEVVATEVSFAEEMAVDGMVVEITETTKAIGGVVVVVQMKIDRISVAAINPTDLMIAIGLRQLKAIGEQLTNPATTTEKKNQNRRKVSR